MINNEVFNEYKDYNKTLHERGNFHGGSLKFEYTKNIKSIVDATNSVTVLDYGCGKAMHYKKEKPINELFNIASKNMRFYDIGVPEYEVIPDGTFDGVICTDVLEHVPEDIIDDVIEQLFSKADKFVFLVISCGLAVKILPNGENAHVTVKHPEWWNSKLKQYYRANRIVHIKYTIPTDPKYNILNL